MGQASDLPVAAFSEGQNFWAMRNGFLLKPQSGHLLRGHLIDLVEQLRQRKVGFKSLYDGAIDTTTASGELIFHIFTALAQFERRLIQEPTKTGLTAARARGRLGGRPLMCMDAPRIQTAKKLHADKSMAVSAICKTLQIFRPTLYRWRAMKSALGTVKC